MRHTSKYVSEEMLPKLMEMRLKAYHDEQKRQAIRLFIDQIGGMIIWLVFIILVFL